MNMAGLLSQPQEKSQLGYKTNTTQNHQKIELYGSQTTKELKKPHSSRWVRQAVMWRCKDGGQAVPHHVWWIKIGRDTLGVRDPSPTPDHPAQGSSARKISPYNFWL